MPELGTPSGEKVPEKGARYSAFISYRHNDRDTAVAAAVQEDLEHFSVPREIRERTGIKRFSRIFRDASELQISESLSDRLEEALDASDFLIVICSPSYRESVWCLHEIEYFLRTHGTDRVLCVLSEGEPPAVFPDLLMRSGEPFACDYRGRRRDARRLELPRLASAMLGCEYEELVRRQEQYRRRRLLTLLAVIVLMTGTAIAYLLYSNARITENYRNAQRQESRTLAEQSLNQLASMNRFAAIRTALRALPDGETDRPVTAEALYALTKASGAYTVPYEFAETWRIDENADFVRMSVDEAGEYLFALDSAGVMHVWSLRERAAVSDFSMFGTETARDFVQGPGRLLVAWTAEGIKAWDLLTGETAWQQELNYNVYGTVRVSRDLEFAAAADNDAVQVMRAADGTPVASLRLPEDAEGYVYDTEWSPDGSRIAVRLRADQQYRTGIFSVDDGSFVLTDPSCADMAGMRFISDDRLITVAVPDRGTSFRSQDAVYLFCNSADVRCFAADGTLLWETQVPYTQPDLLTQIQPVTVGGRSLILVSASNAISLIDPDSGGIVDRYEMDGTIARVLYAGEKMILAVTEEGRLAYIWPEDGETALGTQFPAGLSDAAAVSEADPDRCFILKDGNIQFYEMTYDDGLVLLSDGGLTDGVIGSVHSAGAMAAATLGELVFYDLGSMRETSRTAQGDDVTYIPAGLTKKGSAAVLAVHTDTGEREVLLYTMPEGSLLGRRALPGRDAYAAYGYLEQIADIYPEDALTRTRMLLSAEYTGPCDVCMQDGYVYVLDGPQDEGVASFAVRRIDPDDGSEETFEVRPETEVALCYDRNGLLPSPIFLSPGGKMLYTVVTDVQDGVQRHLVADLAGGSSYMDRSAVVVGSRMADWSGDGSLLAVKGEDAVRILTADGQLSGSIGFEGQEPISMAWEGSKLLVVFPDGALRRYDGEGRPLGMSQLSFTDAGYMDTNSFSFRFSGRGTVILYDGTADMFGPAEYGTYPCCSVPEKCFDYLEEQDAFAVTCSSPSSAGDDGALHAGLFVRRSTGELCRRAEQILTGTGSAE